MQFYLRVIEVAVIDCNCCLGLASISRGVIVALPKPAADPQARPTDEALLARDWIATSETLKPRGEWPFVSFPECCEHLGANVEASRMALLDAIDKAGDFDTDEAWARLEALSTSEPKDDIEPLFEAFRVVSARDQMALFA
jgi:hypothetical protein